MKNKKVQWTIKVIKLNNLEKSDKLLETEFSEMESREKKQENLNSTITTNVIKAVIKILPRSKNPGPNGFRGKFFQKFKK